jgi:integrase
MLSAERLERIFGCPCGWRGRPGQCAAFRAGGCGLSHGDRRTRRERDGLALCDIPQGQEGRPSKSLTYDQAHALLASAESRPLYAYIVVSLLTGARTEELRALTWSHVDLDATPSVIMVWCSVRAGGDTKTRKSRRTLELPQRCADALRLHRDRQDQLHKQAGDR